ncbi:GNAT family N-acetyltransferase [Vibrio diazotrophicus]|uniref:GNAT family N-acetyltransferase n=1 Tax=Vibrio diazotrophicus TaxID=685 RepID=UPI000C9E6639|nr:GNAT family N-acetyltransferase [Vibrio diazotrophicus]PNH78492.1 GNAT family N-acetyltransferase [Vibrio diazotrophicus]PNH93777.1 GNAT family N-acetyltransferase [Vibrio diazotrophicus]PNH98834.1 GNAT family N-acetyltransferase [Vibrio diazotrophicus]
MYSIINVHKYSQGLEKCVDYIHSKWGSDKNYSYFNDAILHSSVNENAIPQFYVLVHQEQIVGCYGLIVNDFISRHDLFPWFSSLFVEIEHRGKNLSETLFKHASCRAEAMGYRSLYLTTEHEGFYEKFGWKRVSDGYDPSGLRARIYRMPLASTIQSVQSFSE